MGAYKYLEELWKKKQCDVLRYLMRIRAWEYRQQTKVCRVTRPTRHDKAHKLGYKAKEGYAIFRSAVRRGSRKRPTHRGVVYGKPKHQGINQIKFARNLQAVAEERVGKKAANLEGAQLLLGQPGRDLQVLRGHLRRPLAPGDSQRPAHQLDLRRDAQAPRVPRPHVGGPQVAGPAQEGPPREQPDRLVAPRHLEAPQHTSLRRWADGGVFGGCWRVTIYFSTLLAAMASGVVAASSRRDLNARAAPERSGFPRRVGFFSQLTHCIAIKPALLWHRFEPLRG